MKKFGLRTLSFLTYRFIVHNSKFIIVLLLVALPMRCAAVEENLPKNDGIFLRSLEDFTVEEKTSPYEDIPSDHWAYGAVMHLAKLGLLEGYDDGNFRGDQPLTRYELAVIISRMIDNLRTWVRTGEVQSSALTGNEQPTTMPYEPGEQKIQEISQPEPGSIAMPLSPASPTPSLTPSSAEEPPTLRKISRSHTISTAAQPEITPTSAAPIPSTSKPGETTLKTTISQEATPQQNIQTKTHTPLIIGETKKEETKKESKEEKEKTKTETKEKKEKEKKIDIPKPLEKTAKKHELTEKDVAIFEALVDYVKDQLKESKKQISSEIRAVKTKAEIAARDIDKLQWENQRFRVTGSGSYTLGTSREYRQWNSAKGQFEPFSVTDTQSTGDTGVSNGTSASFNFRTQPRRTDYLSFDCNLLSCSPNMSYQNRPEKVSAIKNLKLNNINMGSTSLGLSMLTIYGNSYTGFSSQLGIGRYSLQLGIGRTDEKNYLYAASLQFNLFHQVVSMGNLTRIVEFQDNTKGYYHYGEGQWHTCSDAKMGTWIPVGGGHDDVLCTPSESNSVTSFFFRYPFIRHMFITGEYAHSTYGRPGFKMMYSGATQNFDPSLKYSAGGWQPIENESAQDDAFLIDFDYTKGDLQLPFFGYARLGPNFASKYMGIPGLGDITGKLSAIPIQIHSVEAYFLGQAALTKRNRNYKWEYTILRLNEIKPMYLDFSRLTKPVPTMALSRINKRTDNGKVHGWYGQNTLTYYITDNFSVSGKYSYYRIWLGPDCFDSEPVQIKNDNGEIVDVVLGNGVTDCSGPNPQDMLLGLVVLGKTGEYNLYWRFSGKTDYSLTFKSDQLLISAEGNDVLKGAINSMANSGTDYELNQKITYRLTDFASFEFWYNNLFGRPDIFSTPKSKDNTSIGFSMTMNY